MLNVEARGGVARVTLNRPELRNAFDDALIKELTRAFDGLGSDTSVRVVVLAGNGPAFCAGADLNWMKRMATYGYDENLADARALAQMLATLDRLPKPTIARVHGAAFAGGTGLVAACDIAVGTPEAKFCLSEAKLGLSPATISPYVIRAMGERLARRYFLTAEIFDAEEAYRIGLVNEIVPAAELMARAEAILQQIAANGPIAVRYALEATHKGMDTSQSEGLALEAAYFGLSAGTDDKKEGTSAFREKRAPQFRGH